MIFKRLILYILCISLALTALTACTEEKNEIDTTAQSSDAPIDTTPVDPVVLPDAADVLSIFDISACAQTDLVFEAVADGVRVSKYVGSATKVRIPERIGDAPVVEIGDGAFANNETLTVLVLPESLLRVGQGVLSGCSSLSALHTPLMGESVAKSQYLGYLFGSARFEDNPRDVPASLSVLRIGGSPKTLSAYALYDCNDLTFLALPTSLQTVEKFAISRCSALTAIVGLENVQTFGEHAVSYCESLKSLSFGGQTTEIGFSALEGCDALRTLTLPFLGGKTDENTYLGYIFGAAYPDFSKGYYPSGLSRVEILGGKVLGTNAFYECTGLKEIVLPNTLETVGVRAFYGCTSLWSVTLPNSVKTVRESAFARCDALLEITFGEGLSSMGVNAFLNCDSLQRVTLPTSLASLPASAFAGCSALLEVDLGGVRTVGAQAFRGCDSLTAVRALTDVSFGDGNEAAKRVLNTAE